MSEKPVLPVTRENLSSGKLAALVAERNDAETQLATDEQLLASVTADVCFVLSRDTRTQVSQSRTAYDGQGKGLFSRPPFLTNTNRFHG